MIYDINNYPNEVELQNRPKPCCICNTNTHFIDEYTKLYICSDECLKTLHKQIDQIEEGENVW